MKRILVGIDGSKESRRAATLAVDIAAATKAELVLAYVAMPITSPLADEELVARMAMRQDEERERADALAREIADACTRPDVRVKTVHTTGWPAETKCDRYWARLASSWRPSCAGRAASDPHLQTRLTNCREWHSGTPQNAAVLGETFSRG